MVRSRKEDFDSPHHLILDSGAVITFAREGAGVALTVSGTFWDALLSRFNLRGYCACLAPRRRPTGFPGGVSTLAGTDAQTSGNLANHPFVVETGYGEINPDTTLVPGAMRAAWHGSGYRSLHAQSSYC